MQTETKAAIVPFEPENLEQADKLAVRLAQSNLLPTDLRAKPADVLVQMLTGRELGLGAMQAIRSIHIIKGKPTMSAELMVALVKRSPECVRFKLVESDAQHALYETERRGEGVTKIGFTIEDAKRADLVKDGSGWAKFPAAMLRARAAAALCRAVYPDLLLGIYEESEADEIRAASAVAQVDAAVDAYKESTGQKASEQVIDAEVVPTPAFNPAPLLAQIEQAESADALKALIPALQAAPAEHKDALRAAYNARQVAIKSATAEG